MSLRALLLLSMFSVAQAQVPAATSQGGGIMQALIMFVPIFAIMYFLMIRPQQKRQKEHVALMSTVKKGDIILTTSGILGRITHVGENFIQVEIANNTEVRIQKNAVAQIMPKEAYKGEL